MNITQCDDKVIKLINYFSISGNIIPTVDPNSQDYRLRFRAHYDAAQKEISTVKTIRRTHKISQNPIPNQLNNPLYMFDIIQHLDTDLTDMTAKGSKAYTFKVDNIATIYVEEEINGVWTVLETINHTTPVGEFTEYKGLITASSTTNNIRVRFSGSYPYNIRDRALFKYTFPNAEAVPQHQRYNLYTMPTVFYKLNKVVFKGDASQGYPYNPTADFFWEKSNVIAINYYNKGEYTIDYNAYPQDITDSTPSSYEFEVDIEAQELIPFYTAAMVMMDENGNINNKLYAIYQGKVANLDNNISNGATSVLNTMFTGNNGQSKLF